MKKYNVYVYGMISSSRLYLLKSGFPPPDHYAEIGDFYKMIGGEAANSAIVLSVLGQKVKIDGNWLSHDERGTITKKFLDDFKIDTSRLKFKKNKICPDEVVFSDQKTRTIFGNYGTFFSRKRAWNEPVKSDIMNAQMICLDPFFSKASLAVAQYANRYGIPYVTVDCRYTEEIFQKSAIAIISTEFISRVYRNHKKSNLFRKYLKNSKGLVVFTSGNEKILFGRNGGSMRSCQPPKIRPIDTAGAGDSFRAGMIFAALQGWSDLKAITFSSALASLICLRFPGVLNCPSCKDILNFMNKM